MKRLILILIAACAWTIAADAQTQTPVPEVGVNGVSVMRNSDYMAVEMEMDLNELHVRNNTAVLLTPCLVNGDDSLALRSIGVYSRRRYYYYVRNGINTLTGAEEESYRKAEQPSEIAYKTVIPYAEWMNGSKLILTRQDYGCCSALIDEASGPIGAYRHVVYEPEFHYARPVAQTLKTYSLSGRAFIDFPVNRTELYPDYRSNQIELAKIVATIDSVRNDRDVTVTSITIKGFASPESSWENNTRLAKGRTATLKQYVRNLYNFDDDFIRTDYEPEDWAGLRAFVETSNLPHRDQILALIDDTTLAPDPKEWKLKSTYPDEYRFLLNTVYPALRHSDYEITYTVRAYTTPEEIREVLATAPQKLSLNELFVLAQSLDAGSDEYNEVFETAVRMFPNNETANLNAANAAMGRKDYVSAARYLEKAGDSAEAQYARGVLAALQGDYDRAAELVRASNMPDTEGVLSHIEEVKRFGNAAAAE